MNNLAIDPLTGQPINPAAKQQVQPTLTPLAPNGMPVQPVAAQIPNPAVYGDLRVMNTGMAMYGSPEMRQNSVAYMTKAQEDAFGPGSKVYESGNTEIYNALKNK